MNENLLNLRYNQEIVSIVRIRVHDMFLFGVDYITPNITKKSVYIYICDAWDALTKQCPLWYKMQLLYIDSQMIDLVKEDYLKVVSENDAIKEKWFQQLFGMGLGF